LRALSHVVAAESAQALQDTTRRDEHMRQALEQTAGRGLPVAQEIREGAQLRAARWSLEDRDAQAALTWLDGLPQGAGRRTLALRIRLKAARLAQQTQQALETARLLSKHRAFSPAAAQSIVRGLAGDLIAGAHDPAQLQRVWSAFDDAERAMPELAILAAQRLIALQGEPATARSWLLPVWERTLDQPGALADAQRIRLVRALEAGLDTVAGASDRDWLVRIEAAQQRNPRDASLQYLAGMACLKRQLWGKAQQLLTQATHGLQDAGLLRSAWCALAQLAEQRGDAAAAAQAWKQAAQG
jgi:HemY protein